MANRIDRPGHVVQEQDTNRSAPHHPGQKAIPAADPCPTDKTGDEHGEQDYGHEQGGDYAEATIVNQIGRVATPVRSRVALEQPTRVGMPEPLESLGEAVAATGVGAVRVAASVGELMMLAVIGDPADHVPLHGKLTTDREGVANSREGLERPVREQPVVADGDPQPGDDVADAQDRQLSEADHPIPEQRDRDPETDERQSGPCEIGQPPGDAHRRSRSRKPFLRCS